MGRLLILVGGPPRTARQISLARTLHLPESLHPLRRLTISRAVSLPGHRHTSAETETETDTDTAEPQPGSQNAPLATGPTPARRVVHPRKRQATKRQLILLLVAGWLFQAALRAWFSRMQVVPLANPDESAYLIAARVLAVGGPTVDFSASTLYQGGYPLLLAPIYWFTSDPATIYHSVMMINAVISAALMPLAYIAGCRLGLRRRTAYAAAMVTALLPAGFIYSQYAMTDAIFPVIVLAWLLATHSWMTATSRRANYAYAACSALLAGYAYAVHSRGLVIVASYGAVALFMAIRRLAPLRTVAVAAVTLAGTAAAGWRLDRYLAAVLYPEGTRSLSQAAASRLHNVQGLITVLEMAGGQMWRFIIDGWGITAIGLITALGAIVWRGVRSDLRIMAALGVVATFAIATTAPAALPSDQSSTWASGRYLDGMIIPFFLVGLTVLVRASRRWLLFSIGGAVLMSAVTAAIVAHYAGLSLPTNGFGQSFNFAEPAVLTHNWNLANVALATGVALGLLACCVGAVMVFRRRRAWVLAGVAAVSLFATAQITSQVSQASTPSQVAASTSLLTGAHLTPSDRVAVDNNVNWWAWMPQAVEIQWTALQFFNSASQPPPAGATVAEVPWPTGKPAQASWPKAPAGWHVVTSSSTGGWVAWRK